MELFHIVEDAFVVLRSRGLFRQAKVYRRGQALYAGYGVSFVGLRGRGGTTRPDISWEEITEHPNIRLSAGRFDEPLFSAGPVRIGK